jgi:hypothetical protein
MKNLPITIIIKRFEVLKNLILLEDFDDINNTVDKLKEFDYNDDIKLILALIQDKKYSIAISQIQCFISKNNQLTTWQDPEIPALRFEISNLENQINNFDNEKIELEKLISDFQYKHSKYLGDLILKILNLRKINAANKEHFEEATQDEKDYNEHLNKEKNKVFFELSANEEIELKKVFRTASKLCHPDKFINEDKELAELADDIFKELNDANQKNDITRVLQIHENLQKGILKRTIENKIDNKQKLKSTILFLEEKLSRIKFQIQQIKNSETYSTIVEIDDFDHYFINIKEKLMEELEYSQKK